MSLANIAINEHCADYLFLIADDLVFFDFSFINNFEEYLKNKKIGLGYGIDKRCTKDICTHPFICVEHVKCLGYFYPPIIKNWFCDTWITKLYYNLELVYKTDIPVLENIILEKRYNIHKINQDTFNKLVDEAEIIIKEKFK